jgi:hypothetical protein
MVMPASARSYVATATSAVFVTRLSQPILLAIGVSRRGLMGELLVIDALRSKRLELVGLMGRLEQQLYQTPFALTQT